MIPTSFRTRGVIFAYLFGPPRVITRQEGVAVYDAICRVLGVDDLTYKYAAEPDVESAGPPGRSRPYSIQVERRIGRGAFKVSIDNKNISEPIRFLAEYTWPPSVEHVTQDFDASAEATFDALSGGWQRVMAEVRIRAQIEATGGSALTFFSNLLHLDDNKLESLEARPTFLGVRLDTPAGHPTEVDALHQPKRQVTLEVLREDPRSIYIELMSQWPQLAETTAGQIQIDPSRIRPLDDAPSAYLRNSIDYLHDKLFPVFV